MSQINVVLIFFPLIILIILNCNIQDFLKVDFLLLYLIIFTVIFGMFFNNTNPGGVLIVVNFSFVIFVTKYIIIYKNTIKTISFMYFLLLLYWIIKTPTGFNPNTVGLVVAFSYIASNFYLSMIKNNKVRIVTLILTTIGSFVAIFASKSRSFLLCLVLFIIFKYLLPTKILQKRFIYKAIGFIMTFGSIAFVLIYIYIWEKGLAFNIPFTDKKFYTGREIIWRELWIAFKDNYMFGVGTNYELITINVNLNVHNSMYHLLTINGLIVFVCIVALYLRNFFYTRKNLDLNIILIAVSGIIALSIEAFFEVSLIMPNTLPYIMFLFTVANQNPKKVAYNLVY